MIIDHVLWSGSLSYISSGLKPLDPEYKIEMNLELGLGLRLHVTLNPSPAGGMVRGPSLRLGLDPSLGVRLCRFLFFCLACVWV